MDLTGTERERPNGPGRAGRASAYVLAAACALACFGAASPARADQQVVDAAPGAIVRVNIRAGDVTVRTWDRPGIGIDGDPSLSIEKRTVQTAQNAPIAIPQIEQATASGDAVLLPESFVTAPIPPGAHDVGLVKSGPNTPRSPVTVSVPAGTVFVYARAGNGKLDVYDYRGGTLVAVARTGRVMLTNVGGTVFAQTWRGPLIARGSSFDRIRARSLFGNVAFERCDARQIEVTTIGGSIVYDGGTFAPGLARFESTSGNVAIGASGAVQYGAHSVGAGRVYTSFYGRAQVDERPNQTNATVGDGGPVVTATTQGGNVYLYDGSLRNHPQLPPEWQPAMSTLARPALPPSFGPGRENVPERPAPLYLRRQWRARFTPPPAFRRFRPQPTSPG
ncbi:MAG: hypothetical protein IAI48_17535 [Candidatus Eremiobacteraeota bacterium]|nr:hypothetical protein [Candidatus Eremiobacteraeota bacterium]